MPLKIAIDPWVGYQFLFLAQIEGWLDGGDIELVRSKTVADSVAAIREGAVDGAALTLDEVLQLLDRGIDVKVLMVFDSSSGADALLVKPEITRFADLKGKRIAIENTSLGSFMLNKVLSTGGLVREDVEIVLMDFDHVQFWDTHKLDAIISYVPAINQLTAKGLVRLFDTRSIPGSIVDVLAVRTEAVQRNSGALRQLIAGHFLAVNFWRSNPFDANYRFSRHLGVEAGQVDDLFKYLDLPDAPYNRQYLSPPAQELKKTAQELTQIMLMNGQLKSPPKLDTLFLPDYLPGNLE